MFRIYDGRNEFYQWDLNQKLIVEDSTITEVHFANCLCANAQVVETFTEGELTLANVPNILLQEDLDINVYAYDGKKTKHAERFEVNKRTKPADYVYTETEVKNWEDVTAKVDTLEKAVTNNTTNIDNLAENYKVLEEYTVERVNRLDEQVTNNRGRITQIEKEIDTLINDNQVSNYTTWSSATLQSLLAIKKESNTNLASVYPLPQTQAIVTSAPMPKATALTFYMCNKNLLPLSNISFTNRFEEYSSSGVMIKRTNGTTSNNNGQVQLSGTAKTAKAPTLGEVTLPAGTYTYSLGVSPYLGKLCYGQLNIIKPDGELGERIVTGVGNGRDSGTFTLTERTRVRARLYFKEGATFNANDTPITPQIEVGDTYTGCEIYNAQIHQVMCFSDNEVNTYKVNVGKDRGVKNFYTVPTLDVKVEYYEDTLKVIEDMRNAIISLGGNV